MPYACVRIAGLLTGMCATDAALVFQGIGVFDVGLLVMMGRLHELAHHMLPCSAAMAELSMPGRVELLRSRLKPCVAAQSTRQSNIVLHSCRSL